MVHVDHSVSRTTACFLSRPFGAAGRLRYHKETQTLNARTKLNEAYFFGAVLMATAIGVCCNSLTAFYIVAGVLILLQTVTGGIRPGA